MRRRPNTARAPFAPLVFLFALISGWSVASSPETSPSPAPGPLTLPKSTWTRERQALHLLNRAAFGPRKEDLAEVLGIGPSEWLARQLEPSRVPDSALEKRLREFPVLSYPASRMYEEFPRPEQLAAARGIKRDDPDARERLRELIPPEKRPREIDRQMTAQKLLRAAESKRQLQEVLTDFWFNHFNVSMEKSHTRWLAPSYERDAIRPHVFGRFRDLLGATARHPAMLFYLDNWMSTRDGLSRGDLLLAAAGEGYPRLLRRLEARKALETTEEAARSRLGLNENYARELLELHTLGADSGYSQQDVREVARCFTGWSMGRPRGGPSRLRDAEPGTFVFRAAAHDDGPKAVMGLAIPAGGGIQDGERILDFLARHPSTARHLAFKLAQKFISDAPPAPLVEHLASVYLETDGDLSRVYRALFSSPEFWAEEAWLAKTKTPLEFTVSAIRATGAATDGGPLLTKELVQMGQPLYRCQPPTGYKETADAWITPGALVSRMNFAVSLASGRLYGTELPARSRNEEPPGSLESEVDRLALQILGRPLAPATRAIAIEKLARNRAPSPGAPDGSSTETIIALILGSPDFQKQ